MVDAIVSIEDAYGCKRPISVPGISVKVRRIKVRAFHSLWFVSSQCICISLSQPTVKFYGQDGKRHVTVLEHERASLPLRLTGDGVSNSLLYFIYSLLILHLTLQPWRIKYRRAEAEREILTSTLTTPNDHLHVTEKGLYEILEVCALSTLVRLIADSSIRYVDRGLSVSGLCYCRCIYIQS
jgi:nucleoporin POM152